MYFKFSTHEIEFELIKVHILSILQVLRSFNILLSIDKV